MFSKIDQFASLITSMETKQKAAWLTVAATVSVVAALAIAYGTTGAFAPHSALPHQFVHIIQKTTHSGCLAILGAGVFVEVIGGLGILAGGLSFLLKKKPSEEHSSKNDSKEISHTSSEIDPKEEEFTMKSCRKALNQKNWALAEKQLKGGVSFQGDNKIMFKILENKAPASTVTALINAGACVNALNQEGSTYCLHYAAQFSSLEVVQALVEGGADKETENFLDAIPYEECVTFRKNDPNYNALKKSLLSDAILKKLAERPSSHHLMDALEVVDNANQKIDELRLLHRVPSEHHVAHLLQQYQPNLYLKDENGRTPLHCFAEKNMYYAIKELLGGMENSSCFGIQDNFGNTPLHYAAHNNNKPLCQLLIDRGASPYLGTTNKDGKTACELSTDEKIQNIL